MTIIPIYNRCWFRVDFCDRNTAENATRVDVSETFSADQLWFRILSGLFQRRSLPENLWTALIQLWTVLKTEIFRAKNQRWNSADFLWNRADSELNSADFLWNSSESGNFQSKKLALNQSLHLMIFTGKFLLLYKKVKNSEKIAASLEKNCVSFVRVPLLLSLAIIVI